MSRTCVASASLSKWIFQHPLAEYAQLPGPALAVALIGGVGGVSLSGLTSVTSSTPSRSRPATVLARVSPLAFLVLEAGSSYLQWLFSISSPSLDLVYPNATIDNDTLCHFPTCTSIIPKNSVLVYSTDLIIPPSNDLATLAPVSKDLALFDLSPVCEWKDGLQPYDSGEEPPRRRSARIATLSARATATRTNSAPNAGSSRGRGLRVANGRRRSGPPNGGDPAGTGSKNGSSSGRRGRKRAKGAIPAPPGPPSPPSPDTQQDDPDDNSDENDVGWIYFFFSCILFLVCTIATSLKYQELPSYRSEEGDTDVMIVKQPLKGHPFMNTSRLDLTAFILFFILCGPGAEKRRSNIAHILPYQDINIIFESKVIPASAQTKDKYTSSADVDDTFATAIEDLNEGDSLNSEFAFYTDTELSSPYEDRDNASYDFNLSAIRGPPVEILQVPVGAADVPVAVVQDSSVAGVRRKADTAKVEGTPSASSSLIKRRPATHENAVASSSKVTPVVGRLFVPVYRHRRTHPKSITVFVQADAPRERGFIHFSLPNDRFSNNRFMHVDFTRRKTPFFLRDQNLLIGREELGRDGEGDTWKGSPFWRTRSPRCR